MRLAKLLTAVAVASLATSPVLAASAAPKTAAKVDQVRASTKAKKANDAIGGGIIVGVLAAAAVVGGIIIAVDGDDEDDSDSD